MEGIKEILRHRKEPEYNRVEMVPPRKHPSEASEPRNGMESRTGKSDSKLPVRSVRQDKAPLVPMMPGEDFFSYVERVFEM